VDTVIERPEQRNPLPTAAAGTMPAVQLVPHHPSWPARFRVEAEVLRVALSSLSPLIEHIGSTAVPGIAAKPVIDMMVGISQPADIDRQADRLANFGYRLVTGIEYLQPGRRLLVRTVRGVKTHQVHVVEAFGEHWHRLLLFRDMRIDRRLAEAYAALKQRLAEEHPGSAVAYASGKSNFVASVLGVSAH
jgi:GrpB-like predicted nucleotidyltransferase (UPF0157 family)